MNSKPDEKTAENKPLADEPAGTVLRLVPRPQRNSPATPMERPARQRTGNQANRPTWDGDDDDPGPTAA